MSLFMIVFAILCGVMFALGRTGAGYLFLGCCVLFILVDYLIGRIRRK